MSRLRNVLTVKDIEPAVKRGLTEPLKDGGGLFLMPNLRWVYFFKMKVGGTWKDRELWLGVWPELTLKKAREKRDDAEKLKKGGIDPAQERRGEAKASRDDQTFAEFALEFQDALGPPGAAGRKVWLEQMTTPKMLGRLVNLTPAEIGLEEVEAALKPHWAKQPTSVQLRMRIRRVLASARTRGMIKAERWINPAIYRDVLETIMPRQAHESQPRPSCPWEDLPDFMAGLRATEAKYGPIRELVAWIILTASRVTSAAGARWGEIDLKARTWTIPKERMKAYEGYRREHVVPLTLPMVRILKAVRPPHRKPRPDEFIFPSCRSKGGRFGISGVNVRVKLVRQDVCAHGFRATFATWAEEVEDASDTLIRACIGHVKRTRRGEKVLSRYARSQLMAKRRKLMRKWARYCAQVPAPVALPLAA